MRLDLGLGLGSRAPLARGDGVIAPPPVGPPAGFDWVTAGGQAVTVSGEPVIARTGA